MDHGTVETRDEAFARLNKALRIKNAKIEVSSDSSDGNVWAKIKYRACNM